MAQRVERFAVSVDANGESVELADFAGGEGIVTAIGVEFPSGCAQLVGAQVFYAGVQLVPRTPGEWLRGNGQTRRFELTGFPTGTSWSLFLDSTDLYAHTITFTFELDEVQVGGAGAFDFPPLVLIPFDESLIGAIQQVQLDGSQVSALGGIPLPGGGVSGGGGTTGPDYQAELDALRVAILSASTEQQRLDMQARINQLVAMGYV